jgi:hypothetical protein
MGPGGQLIREDMRVRFADVGIGEQTVLRWDSSSNWISLNKSTHNIRQITSLQISFPEKIQWSTKAFFCFTVGAILTFEIVMFDPQEELWYDTDQGAGIPWGSLLKSLQPNNKRSTHGTTCNLPWDSTDRVGGPRCL